mgnify:CR=1 FL=1
MKRIAVAIATGLGLGLATFATPANAALFSWNVEYTGWWEADGGGSISGQFIANEKDALDGIVSIDEMTSWMWNWSGNDAVSAFSISSKDAGASPDFDSSFYVDGRLNQPNLLDGLDQGTFISGNEVLDLEFLFAISFADNVESFSPGNVDSTSGTVTVSDPTPVPEPTSILGLLALAGAGTATLRRQKQEA